MRPRGQFFLAAVAAAVLQLAGPGDPVAALRGPILGFCRNFSHLSLDLALFNCLPALPLDGGRVARAVLAARVGAGRATRTLARAGRLLALGLAVHGAVMLARGGVPWGLVVAPSLWLGAAAARREAAFQVWRDILGRAGAGPGWVGAGPGRAITLWAPASTPAHRVVAAFSPGRYHLVAVVDAGGRLLGILGAGDLVAGMASAPAGATLGKVLAASSAGVPPPPGLP